MTAFLADTKRYVQPLLAALLFSGCAGAQAADSSKLNLRLSPSLHGEKVEMADARLASARVVPVIDNNTEPRLEAERAFEPQPAPRKSQTQAKPAPKPEPKAEAAAVEAPVDAGKSAFVEMDTAAAPEGEGPSIMLGAGDSITMQVFGRPEMNTTTYVADDGTVTVPLAGKVKVAGLSPDAAATRIADALRDGQFLLRPSVTLTLAQVRSQQVSVLGEVRNPGRFPIESRTTVFDVLAQAGGTTEGGADVIYVLRPDKKGVVTRIPVDLKALKSKEGDDSRPRLALRGGDSVYVPNADRFYIYGEVQQPNMYRLEPGMTVIQAIARGGGITPRGSNSRIEIQRQVADGKLKRISAELSDVIEPNDVVRVKERLF